MNERDVKRGYGGIPADYLAKAQLVEADFRAKEAKRGLPTEATQRKQTPMDRGLFQYFPDALAEVAHVSFVGNEQHNPGQPIHWAKEKSTDEGDALLRHQLEHGKIDTDGIRHSAKVAWRALAQLQREIEAEAGE